MFEFNYQGDKNKTQLTISEPHLGKCHPKRKNRLWEVLAAQWNDLYYLQQCVVLNRQSLLHLFFFSFPNSQPLLLTSTQHHHKLLH